MATAGSGLRTGRSQPRDAVGRGQDPGCRHTPPDTAPADSIQRRHQARRDTRPRRMARAWVVHPGRTVNAVAVGEGELLGSAHGELDLGDLAAGGSGRGGRADQEWSAASRGEAHSGGPPRAASSAARRRGGDERTRGRVAVLTRVSGPVQRVRGSAATQNPVGVRMVICLDSPKLCTHLPPDGAGPPPSGPAPRGERGHGAPRYPARSAGSAAGWPAPGTSS